MRLKEFAAIIIGAGIGGLSTAAYLAKNGIKPLIIEQTPFPGGRCYTRVINGEEHDIGALYIGERTSKILKNVFDIKCTVKPYKIGIKFNESWIYLPFDRRTLQEFRKWKMPYKSLISLLLNTPKLFSKKAIDKFESVGDALDSIIADDTIRQSGYVLFGALGVSPYRLPSHYLRMDKKAAGTRVGNPIHYLGGNKTVADLLVDYIKENGGEFSFKEKAIRIIIDDRKCIGVETDKNRYIAPIIVSNTDIQTTVLKLCQIKFDEPYIKEIESLAKPLSLVCIFVTFDPSAIFPDGLGAFFLSGIHPKEEFDALNSGKFPRQSTFCLQIPTNIEKRNNNNHIGTVQFYHPIGHVEFSRVVKQANWVLNCGFDQLFPNLSKKVIAYKIYNPERYYKDFGLKPYVFGVSPDLKFSRFPNKTPFSNLFCVGDSVQPERPSVAQAMESGVNCGRLIIDK